MPSCAAEPLADLDTSANGRAIYIVNADGTNLRRVTPWRLKAGDHPDWSPDGTSILFRTIADSHGDFSPLRALYSCKTSQIRCSARARGWTRGDALMYPARTLRQPLLRARCRESSRESLSPMLLPMDLEPGFLLRERERRDPALVILRRAGNPSMSTSGLRRVLPAPQSSGRRTRATGPRHLRWYPEHLHRHALSLQREFLPLRVRVSARDRVVCGCVDDDFAVAGNRRQAGRERGLLEALHELRNLRRGEPLADRRVPANVGEEDRQGHDRPALGCALDAACANLRVLPRRRIADPPDGSRIGAAERGVAEFAAPRARQESEQPPTCPKRQRERVLPGKDPRPACAHRWDPVRVIARLLVCHSAQTSLGDAHRVPLRIAGSFRMCWSDRSVITTGAKTAAISPAATSTAGSALTARRRLKRKATRAAITTATSISELTHHGHHHVSGSMPFTSRSYRGRHPTSCRFPRRARRTPARERTPRRRCGAGLRRSGTPPSEVREGCRGARQRGLRLEGGASEPSRRDRPRRRHSRNRHRRARHRRPRGDRVSPPGCTARAPSTRPSPSARPTPCG